MYLLFEEVFEKISDKLTVFILINAGGVNQNSSWDYRGDERLLE